jgi:hypothetical protein
MRIVRTLAGAAHHEVRVDAKDNAIGALYEAAMNPYLCGHPHWRNLISWGRRRRLPRGRHQCPRHVDLSPLNFYRALKRGRQLLML